MLLDQLLDLGRHSGTLKAHLSAQLGACISQEIAHDGRLAMKSCPKDLS